MGVGDRWLHEDGDIASNEIYHNPHCICFTLQYPLSRPSWHINIGVTDATIISFLKYAIKNLEKISFQ
jgi:hypothetical protein